MTLEEKIAHLQATSMEEARAQGNEIIDSYRDALEKVLQDHKVEAQRQSEIRIKNRDDQMQNSRSINRLPKHSLT